jgi:hypothetical protein
MNTYYNVYRAFHLKSLTQQPELLESVKNDFKCILQFLKKQGPKKNFQRNKFDLSFRFFLISQRNIFL